MSGYKPKASKVELEIFERLLEIEPTATSGVLLPDVRLARKHLVYVDCFIPERKISIEYDGFYWHSRRYYKDSRKSKEILKAGYTLIRLREYPLSLISLDHPRFFQISYTGNFEQLSKVLALVS